MDDSLLDSAFEDGGASSEDFVPKPKKAVAKKVTAKAAAGGASKPKAAPKPRAKAAPKKRAKIDSDIENSDIEDHDSFHDNTLLSNTPPKKAVKATGVKKSSGKPLKEIDNESFDFRDESMVSVGKAPANNSDKYKMISHIEHILIRPDTYIGSVEKTKQEMWAYNSATEAIEFREVTFVPGLYKIFDEILVNAADNKQNDASMNEIKVTVDRESGQISVWNNGKGIPVEIHAQHKIYIPEMIFGHLLTSSNYDDNQAKITGGRNGYGAKLCNVFSTEFSIETVDSKRKKKYKQTWTKNMSEKGKAKITDFGSGSDYTKVTFTPDYAKFSMDGMDDDFEAIVKRRIYDIAGTCKGVKVSLNGDRIKIRSFQEYMTMYTKAIKPEHGEEGSDKKDVIIIDTPHERWQVGFAVSDGSFKQVSFVNSIATTSGGTHVKYIADQIVNNLLEYFKSKNKKSVALKNHQIQNHIFLFVNCQIVNPAFTSQTKEQLTTKSTQFGSKPTVGEAFLKKIRQTEVMDNITHFAEKKADQMLAKSDGSKRARMNNSKLTDANKAGTKDGHKCTLILTEGDSASGLALAGRAVLDPDHIGVFPLRGKLLNVRDASITQISNNEEIQNIKKFIGLQHKKEYTDTRGLRYGHVMIMTDQDHDGSHIKGLLINFFQAQFPSLLKLPDFLNVFITPIVKVWKGDPKDPAKVRRFYTMPEYEAWKQLPGSERWEFKYYKGLGTNDHADGEMYFRDLDRHLKNFDPMRREEEDLIDLAFSKKKADARKNWLRDFIPGTHMDLTPKNISYDDFVNKELILFSMADNMRSIPSVVDGLKPSQRKVLYTCFTMNLKKDRKVVELAGAVAGSTAYPYGETSLQQTIVGLAQTFVGSNNVNCLEPSGNFGSRRLGGNDAASPRYIYTRLSPFGRKIFHPADDALLHAQYEDGKKIEPLNYVPVVPLLLLNGADGIGTGWSTFIPNYKPEDIVENLKRRMQGTSKEDMTPMNPWYRGFKGPIEDVGGDRWKVSGMAQQTAPNEIEVTELPVRMWTQDFKDKLENNIKDEKDSVVKDYAEYNTPADIHFVVKIEQSKMSKVLEKGIEEQFKLSKTLATSNMVAFDAQGRIHKYDSVMDIMEEFYHVRLKMYEKRKQHLLDVLHTELERFTNQARFIQMIIDGKLVVSKKKKLVLVEELRKLGFKPFPKIVDAKKYNENEPTVEDEESPEDSTSGGGDYDYLLGMAIWSLTQERVEKLLKQIGDKELQIDDLLKVSPKELWNRDLDEFLEEWQTQLSEEKKRRKKNNAIGRRGSAKLGLAGKTFKRKRKGDESDDDFTVGKKPSTLKAVLDRTKGHSALSSYFNKDEESKPPVAPVEAPSKAGANDDDFMDIDEFGYSAKPAEEQPQVLAVKNKFKSTAAAKAKVVKKEENLSDVDDVFAAVEKQVQQRKASDQPARQARAASKKTTYVMSSSDEEDSFASNGDDMLGDVSMMVKGIGTTSSGENTLTGNRPLFSNTAGRPSSAHGLPRSISKARLTLDPHQNDDSDGIDETDYKSLIPQGSPLRPAARRAGEAKPLDDDDGDDIFDVPSIAAKPKVLAKKKIPLTKTKPVTSKAAKAAVSKTESKKPTGLSPSAKAYAAKQAKLQAAAAAGAEKKPAPAKKKKATILDDDDELANAILTDDEPAVTRPSRRAGAPASKKSQYVFSDDDEDEEEEPEEDSFMDEDSD